MPDLDPQLVEAAKRDHDFKFDTVTKPAHYNFTEDPAYEPIKVIEAWKLGFHLGNTVKYIARAGRKLISGSVLKSTIEDLKKARWYLDRYICLLEKQAEKENKA